MFFVTVIKECLLRARLRGNNRSAPLAASRIGVLQEQRGELFMSGHKLHDVVFDFKCIREPHHRRHRPSQTHLRIAQLVPPNWAQELKAICSARSRVAARPQPRGPQSPDTANAAQFRLMVTTTLQLVSPSLAQLESAAELASPIEA